jgi:hypothetical protein
VIEARNKRTTYGGFCVIQLDSSRKATLCEQAKLRYDELVELPMG